MRIYWSDEDNPVLTSVSWAKWTERMGVAATEVEEDDVACRLMVTDIMVVVRRQSEEHTLMYRALVYACGDYPMEREPNSSGAQHWLNVMRGKDRTHIGEEGTDPFNSMPKYLLVNATLVVDIPGKIVLGQSLVSIEEPPKPSPSLSVKYENWSSLLALQSFELNIEFGFAGSVYVLVRLITAHTGATEIQDLMQRARRVECGEESPECLRCAKTRRRCDGYDPDRPEMSSTALARKASVVSSLSARTVASPIRNYTASKSHYRLQISKETRRNQERCHSDPPILHAVILLGFIHEFFKFGDVELLEAGSIDDPKQRFALIQNNKAIQHLTDGLKILGDWMERNGHNPQTCPEPNLTRGLIRSEFVRLPLFDALNIQATEILPTTSIPWGMTMGSTRVDFRTQSTTQNVILSLSKAKYHLQNLTHGILEYNRSAAEQHSSDRTGKDVTLRSDTMDAIIEENRRQALQLEQWSSVFNIFA
ncbi:hypothetical protein SBOR_3440 [Sclerotinia borealis F-4128]|uniref:Zn(2)-C6 fungal-type domain-containing protein n=1 Tax=Sclerotinia borealis (strain F-4128) TaxID=1432307 RepID=W9CNT4_SCLBF|nr:hypothetical protein SBOR_3440 [Sclerotinia borealis F-4128]